MHFDVTEFYLKAPLVALADLAKEPYKLILQNKSVKSIFEQRDKKKETALLLSIGDSLLIDTKALTAFLRSTRKRRLVNVEKVNRKNESYL